MSVVAPYKEPSSYKRSVKVNEENKENNSAKVVELNEQCNNEKNVNSLELLVSEMDVARFGKSIANAPANLISPLQKLDLIRQLDSTLNALQSILDEKYETVTGLKCYYDEMKKLRKQHDTMMDRQLELMQLRLSITKNQLEVNTVSSDIELINREIAQNKLDINQILQSKLEIEGELELCNQQLELLLTNENSIILSESTKVGENLKFDKWIVLIVFVELVLALSLTVLLFQSHQPVPIVSVFKPEVYHLI